MSIEGMHLGIIRECEARIADLNTELQSTAAALHHCEQQRDRAEERLAEANAGNQRIIDKSVERVGIISGKLQAAEARVRELGEALSHLEKAEHDYRLVYQSQGGGHRETGRVWDRLRKAGDVARAARTEESSRLPNRTCNEVVEGRLCQMREDHKGPCNPRLAGTEEPTDGT